MYGRIPPLLRPLAGALALAAALAVQGCAAFNTAPPRYGPRYLVFYAQQILNVDEPSPAFYRERARLEALGPELDEVLVGLLEDATVGEVVRANALVLLADRGTPGTLELARRHLAANPSEVVRLAAVDALQRYVADSPAARNAFRAAIGDPSPRVRLTVLQRMEVGDVALVRDVVAAEDDRQVRQIARQLVGLLEARGAPLARDGRGHLRTTGPDTVPHIVFHPVERRGATARGAVWVEMPGAELLPLAPDVEVVADVVPAFFDARRSAVVYEADRTIWVRDLATGETRRVGAGIAPRTLPFTDGFVFLREAPGGRTDTDQGTVLEYDVLRADFRSEPRTLGRVRALARTDRRGGASPARWMAVDEIGEHFVLRAGGMTPFVLPGAFDAAAAPGP
jgi:hypothetical protein